LDWVISVPKKTKILPISNPDQKMKIQRNDNCPCGSRKKYKKCCLALGGKLEKTHTFEIFPTPEQEKLLQYMLDSDEEEMEDTVSGEVVSRIRTGNPETQEKILQALETGKSLELLSAIENTWKTHTKGTIVSTGVHTGHYEFEWEIQEAYPISEDIAEFYKGTDLIKTNDILTQLGMKILPDKKDLERLENLLTDPIVRKKLSKKVEENIVNFLTEKGIPQETYTILTTSESYHW
jgi:hypothetical protein